MQYYIIPSDNRELQHREEKTLTLYNYIIPSDNRELQLLNGFPVLVLIISYQVITGNYNSCIINTPFLAIISYQVITGNYNENRGDTNGKIIISYQVITGNYNVHVSDIPRSPLYHTK